MNELLVKKKLLNEQSQQPKKEGILFIFHEKINEGYLNFS